MGACAAHFKHRKYREPLPSSETLRPNLPDQSQKIIDDIRNTPDAVRVVSRTTQIVDVSVLCHDRPSDFFMENKKQIESKEIQLNERVMNWIDENDRNYSLSPPNSMLSLNTLIIREHEPPRRKTNKQEIIEQKIQNKQKINAYKTNNLTF